MDSLVLALLSLAFIQKVQAHPQCLDGKPPFVSSPRLEFCSEYSAVGCCTALEDSRLQTRYMRLIRSIPSTSCHAYVKALLCQSCSPYAAHLFNFEETGIVSPTPGLCTSYCTRLYDTCGAEALKLLSNDEEYKRAVLTKSGFCAYSRLSDEDYCYPELKTNPTLTDKFTRPHNDSEGCMCLQKLADGHGLITFIENNPDAIDLIYVGEQNGKVYVYSNGIRRRRLFIDLSKTVLLSRFVGDERGLLGMVFDPQFASNRRVYMYYVLSGTQGQTVRISQWVARNKFSLKKSSERVILDIPQPYFNHNGGQMLFGDDDYLYIFTGDGGGAGDREGNGQNLNTLLGKALRIDVNNKRRGYYTIPADNPFVGRTRRGEIYAYGLRNAWRCSKDEGDHSTGAGRGRIFCGDVGQDKYEEIDIIEKGGNYGWSAREGFECFKPALCRTIGEEVLPIHAYNHSYGKSVTGGYVYRGCEYPSFNGAYIYGDFTSGRIFKLEERNFRWRNSEVVMCSSRTCTGNWVSTYGKGISTFGTNSHGDILMASSSDDFAYGDGSSIYKLIMTPFRREDPTSCNPEAEVSIRSVSKDPDSHESEDESTSEQAIDSVLVPALPTTTTGPEASSEDYGVVYDPFTGQYRQLADLIAHYKALIKETEAAIKQKEQLIEESKMEQTSTPKILSPTLQTFSTPARRYTPPSTASRAYNMERLTQSVSTPSFRSITTSVRVPPRTLKTISAGWRYSNTKQTTLPMPSIRTKRIYSQLKLTTVAPTLRTYSWQGITRNKPSRVIVRRLKSSNKLSTVGAGTSTRETTESLVTTTQDPYLYLPTALPATAWWNVRQTTTRRRYEPRFQPVTSYPLWFVTNYELPEYIQSGADVSKRSDALDRLYIPRPRRLVSNYRYQRNGYI